MLTKKQMKKLGFQPLDGGKPNVYIHNPIGFIIEINDSYKPINVVIAIHEAGLKTGKDLGRRERSREIKNLLDNK